MNMRELSEELNTKLAGKRLTVYIPQAIADTAVGVCGKFCLDNFKNFYSREEDGNAVVHCFCFDEQLESVLTKFTDMLKSFKTKILFEFNKESYEINPELYN